MSIRDGKFHEHLLPGEPSRNRVKSLLQTSDGAIWVGTVSGLYRSPNGEAPFERVPGVQGTVRVLRQIDDGTLWMSIVGQGGGAWNAGRGIRLASPRMRISGTVLSIFEDSERNVWAGTQSGMIRYSQTPVRIVQVADARNSDFGTIYLDTDGTVWSAATHLTRISQGQATTFNFAAIHGAKVRNLLRDRDGTLWIGTDGSGLFHLPGGSALGRGREQRYTAANGLVNNFIRVIVQARDRSLWIGTDEGVSHLVNGRLTNYGIADGLAYFSIRCMLEDSHGGLWIGSDQGLSHIVQGRFENDAPVTALQQEKVWAIHEDPDGGLWFGTRNHGLYRYRTGRLTHFGVKDGLPSNAIFSILEDAAGHFWISSSEGVALLDRNELDAYAEALEPNKAHPFSVSSFDLPDDEGPVEIFGGVQNAGSITSSGDAWYPSSRGPVHVTLPEARPWTMPALLIDRVSADHETRGWTPGAEAQLEPGNSRLNFAWGLTQLSSQENARFRYRLVNFDREWVNALERRDASYANLPPGRYVFQVAAYQTNHPGVVTQVELAVVKSPYFYRRWWFLVCVAVALLVIALGFYRARIQRMKQRFIGVLEERNRIAREIHDTVIQGCTGVSAALEAATTIPAEQEDLREELIDRARIQVRDTINEARRAVWDLRQEAARGLLDSSLSKMSAQIATEFGIPVRCTVRGRPFRASQPVTHEILMIAREAVHNAVLHGSPSAVDVTAEFGNDLLTLEIADDGHGFDLDLAATGKRHFGLLGMRERAARLMGKIEIRSELGLGTRVLLRVPKKGRAASETQVDEVKAL